MLWSNVHGYENPGKFTHQETFDLGLHPRNVQTIIDIRILTNRFNESMTIFLFINILIEHIKALLVSLAVQTSTMSEHHFALSLAVNDTALTNRKKPTMKPSPVGSVLMPLLSV